jgi:HSP20 family protein
MANLKNEDRKQEQRGELVGTERSQLMRDPYQSLRRDPFRLMREMMSDPLRWLQIPSFRELAGDVGWNPDFEVRETDDAFVFKADMPGVRSEDLDVSLDGNDLQITGKREQESERGEGRFHAYERSYGSFVRTFSLPDSADLNKIRSDLKDGVLTLVIPKQATAATQRRKIQIGSGTKS